MQHSRRTICAVTALTPSHLKPDVLIFGGGIAGLWTLDELTRRGFSALLLESDTLGSPQSVCAQGILHSGIKYTLGGKLTGAASHIGDVPAHWQACLAGAAFDETGQPTGPDLRAAIVRNPSCFMWRTRSLKSIGAMVGARAGLKTKPQRVATVDRPAALAGCPGDVFSVNEIVIDPISVLEAFAALHVGRIARYDPSTLSVSSPVDSNAGDTRLRLTIAAPDHAPNQTLTIAPANIVLTAGAGNAPLRRLLGGHAKPVGQTGLANPAGPADAASTPPIDQIRPLHMAMVRGPQLPWLSGHCVDGLATRLTITPDHWDRNDPPFADASEREIVWQLGGQLAERGVDQSEAELIATARQELAAVLPGADLGPLRFAAYRVDRAEGRTPDGKRPDDVIILDETVSDTDSSSVSSLLTCWPTKLVLAPKLAASVADTLSRTNARANERSPVAFPATFPVPKVARAPWHWPEVTWQ